MYYVNQITKIAGGGLETRLLTGKSVFCSCVVGSTMSGPVGKFVDSLIKQTVCIATYTTITLMFFLSRLDSDEPVDINRPAPAEQDTTYNTTEQLHPAKHSIAQETIAEEKDSSLLQDQGIVQSSSSSREETSVQMLQHESSNDGTSVQHSKTKVKYVCK